MMSPDTCKHRWVFTPNVNEYTREVLYECCICRLQQWW